MPEPPEVAAFRCIVGADSRRSLCPGACSCESCRGVDGEGRAGVGRGQGRRDESDPGVSWSL